MACVLAGRGGAGVAGMATTSGDAAVIEGGRCPRCGAMALIAACRSRQVVGVLAGRSGAVMAGVATADGYSTVVECCWCPSRGAMALIAARRGWTVHGVKIGNASGWARVFK